jgi:hypothetical protein
VRRVPCLKWEVGPCRALCCSEGVCGEKGVRVGVEDDRGCHEGRVSRYVTVDRQDFGEEIGGVDEAGKEDKADELLTGPLLHPV